MHLCACTQTQNFFRLQNELNFLLQKPTSETCRPPQPNTFEFPIISDTNMETNLHGHHYTWHWTLLVTLQAGYVLLVSRTECYEQTTVSGLWQPQQYSLKNMRLCPEGLMDATVCTIMYINSGVDKNHIRMRPRLTLHSGYYEGNVVYKIKITLVPEHRTMKKAYCESDGGVQHILNLGTRLR
jgi:hypothetical protein